MSLPEEYFTPLCDGRFNTLRLLHYPSCDRSELSDDVARYCALRLPRHPRAVVSFINQLDQLSLAQRRAVTIPFVRESGLLRQAEG